eukprot:CAMPEP_0170568992 /NCGR_PEP_ID=MMETSP0224-20130122/280_1 /TAXON_ID=285029 /ORGANISM="Togula jolla, Strain CCCM 725" /LENGTH=100 /DNA_ID=CAMNT_0010891055 /DNA_START=62 /DNA_END=365 /DNA_ORIENTATION=-
MTSRPQIDTFAGGFATLSPDSPGHRPIGVWRSSVAPNACVEASLSTQSRGSRRKVSLKPLGISSEWLKLLGHSTSLSDSKSLSSSQNRSSVGTVPSSRNC